MPTQQEMHILTLIGGMKEAVKRSADGEYCSPILSYASRANPMSSASDSEESVQQITNRSNKLKKKAKFVHEGQLGLPNGPQVYKKVSCLLSHLISKTVANRLADHRIQRLRARNHNRTSTTIR